MKREERQKIHRLIGKKSPDFKSYRKAETEQVFWSKHKGLHCIKEHIKKDKKMVGYIYMKLEIYPTMWYAHFEIYNEKLFF